MNADGFGLDGISQSCILQCYKTFNKYADKSTPLIVEQLANQ